MNLSFTNFKSFKCCIQTDLLCMLHNYERQSSMCCLFPLCKYVKSKYPIFVLQTFRVKYRVLLCWRFLFSFCIFFSFQLCIYLTVWLAEDCHFGPNAPKRHLWVSHDHNFTNLLGVSHDQNVQDLYIWGQKCQLF